MFHCDIVHTKFFNVLSSITCKHVYKCTFLLSKNVLPYNVISISDTDITFFTQDRKVYNEILTNKTDEQLLLIVHAIFDYQFNHLHDTTKKMIQKKT